jgi:hypothetical protein
MPVPCPYCGEQHPEGTKFCGETGRPLARSAGPDDLPSPPSADYRGVDKGVWDLMKEALELYRAHARVFLLTAAVLMVPGSLVRSCALAAILGPMTIDGASAQQAALRLARRTEDLARSLERTADPRATDEGARPSSAEAQAVEREAGQLARMTLGGVAAGLLELAGWAITALILYGLALPLTHGALTIAVADRVLGGTATWREHWMLLFRRMGLLLTAVLPAAALVMLGYFCLVIPGLLLSFFFVFVAPVVLIEGLGGTAALKRSYTLVRADWLRTALLLLTFGVLNGLAHWLVGLFVPRSAVFFGSFLGDLLLLAVMPVPIIASVLLYFDLRRKVDGLTDDRLRAELAALR